MVRSHVAGVGRLPLQLLGSGTSRRPSSMLVREMVSYAPIPSTDSMVWFGWASVAEVRAWTMASVPARVERANW